MQIESDSRIVITLDAGGTNFRFGAMRGGKPIIQGVHLPSNAGQLDSCIRTLFEGFQTVRNL